MIYPRVKLKNHIDVLSGFAFKSKDFTNTGVPVIKIKNVTPPAVTLDDLSYVSKEIAQTQNRFLLNYNDVLIALTGSHINQMASVVGRVARVRYHTPSLLNQRVGKITVINPDETDLNYVYYYLSQDTVKIQLASKAGGTANQANISPSDVKDLCIPFPNIDVQRRIVGILSAYDDLIENNRKQIKLLEQAAQRLYKEWFVDLRFPGYENTAIIDGVPEGWRKGILGEIAEFKRGKTITKAQVTEGDVPVVAGGLEPAYYHNKSNTVAPVITVSGSGANAGFTRLYYVNVFASDCSFLDSSSTDYTYFVYCFLKSQKKAIDTMQKGSAQPHVYAKDLNRIKTIIPQSEYIKSFCNMVKPFYKRTGNLEKQSQMAAEARDRLLPKLMSGEIEV